MFQIHIPAKTKYILSRLTECGFEAYVVGGCVRDALMGRTPHDWDITTSATPEQVFFCFEGKYIIPTGLKHGTVTVVHEQEPFEVTTFRIDGDYTDGRHPDNVIFTTSLKKDLARRDFTINAMAADKDGNIIDPFGGMTDIQKKQIRCVGSAENDFLRMHCAYFEHFVFRPFSDFPSSMIRPEQFETIRICCLILHANVFVRNIRSCL